MDLIEAVALPLGLSLPSVQGAWDRSMDLKARLADATSGVASLEDASVVVFGSLARNELTSQSDTDWALLVDGQASSTHFDTYLELKRRLVEASVKPPGREATFGTLAFSHDLLNRIGGPDDSNTNLTQRILLLLESSSLGSAAAHQRVLSGVLRRYVAEDTAMQPRTSAVPRFLLNDIVRYWRTITVDFAYKRRDRGAEGWALRRFKLQMSRKLIFASGLLSCLSCGLALAAEPADDMSKALMAQLLALAALTPLERMAKILREADLARAAGRLMVSYDGFIALLDDDGARAELEHLSPQRSTDSAVHRHAREIAQEFQSALDEIFFGGGSPIAPLTRKYGVF